MKNTHSVIALFVGGGIWSYSLVTGNCQLLYVLVIDANLYPFGIK